MTAASPTAVGSERQLVWLYTPAAARADVAAVLALEAEIGAGARPGLEHDIAHARLAWWVEEAAALAAGRARHPLGRQLTARFAAHGLSPPDLRGLVRSVRCDLACTAFESIDEYTEYLSFWSQSVFRSLALCLAPQPEARAALERFCGLAGPAVRDLELVARLAADARLGRVHLPLVDAVTASGYAAWQQQPWPPAQVATLRERLAARRAALGDAARALPPAQRPRLRALLVWCALAERRAGHCQAALPFQYDAGRFDAMAAAWRAWRTALAAARGRLPAALQESR